MRKTKPFVKDRILAAIGIDLGAKEVKVSWEQFLEIIQMLNIKCQDKEKQMNFIVKLFDPRESGFIRSGEFEETIK